MEFLIKLYLQYMTKAMMIRDLEGALALQKARVKDSTEAGKLLSALGLDKKLKNAVKTTGVVVGKVIPTTVSFNKKSTTIVVGNRNANKVKTASKKSNYTGNSLLVHPLDKKHVVASKKK